MIANASTTSIHVTSGAPPSPGWGSPPGKNVPEVVIAMRQMIT